MKVNLINMHKTTIKQVELPEQFNEPVREDLIKKAVLTIQNNKRQPYGAMPEAGKRPSADLSRRRRKYRGSYGYGIARVPRKILSRRGTRMNWVGAFAPGTVGGRRAHPPKAGKLWKKKMNTKERRKAIRAALAATFNLDYVKNRGHKLPKEYPFIIEDKIEDLTKTKQVQELLLRFGFEQELLRINQKTVRAGKGKMRGRKYKTKTGPLLVVSKECSLMKAASNMLGIDTVNIENINAELLAPGCMPGRLTIFSHSAIKRLEQERLFMNDYKKKKEVPLVEAKKEAVKEEKKESDKTESKDSAPLPKVKETESKKDSESLAKPKKPVAAVKIKKEVKKKVIPKKIPSKKSSKRKLTAAAKKKTKKKITTATKKVRK